MNKMASNAAILKTFALRPSVVMTDFSIQYIALEDVLSKDRNHGRIHLTDLGMEDLFAL